MSNPKLTYQKANGIVKKFIEESSNNINPLKFKIEKNFKIVQYVYSLLYPKINNRINNFGIQNKNSFDFFFSNWKARKQNEPISPKIINALPALLKQILVTEMLSKPKNPKDYQGREVNEHEQAPIAPSPKLVAEIEIKKTKKFDKTDGSAKKVMDMRTAKRRAGEKKENLQRQLSKNTAKMNIIKKVFVNFVKINFLL